MALQAAYLQFLAAPSSSSLTDDAALYYITTTTVFHGATEIIKHFSTQRNQLNKKKEDVLSAVESSNALALEVDTSVQFLTSGAAYLPALDDNFLADRIVHMPVIHIVSFDAQGKIAQIRQSWDQGALLKQIDVIGRSGRNWPIRDGADQTKLIATAVGITKEIAANAAPSKALPVRSRGSSETVKRDPHASLDLFAPREELESATANVISPYAGVRPRQRDISEILSMDGSDETPRAVISPYAGRRPRQRSFTEIIGDDDDEEYDETTDTSYDGTSSRVRSRSPSRVIAPKAGAAKKFQPVRLFQTDDSADVDVEDDSPDDGKKPQRFYRPNPKKYDHFDFADGSDPQDAPQSGASLEAVGKSKHDSQWSFDDFVTPQKPVARIAHGQEVRHWTLDDEDLPETPKAASHKPIAARARPSAETHFEFQDDGESPPGESRATGRQRGAGHNEGLGLYKNNLYKEDGSAPTPAPRALDNITNNKDRSKAFGSHFTMADHSPSSNGPTKPAVISEDRKKVVKMMESSWDVPDDDDETNQKENHIPGTNVVVQGRDNRGIQTVGDGMGGKKTAQNVEGDNRGIQTAGDGMGGKKSGAGWRLGQDYDDDDEFSNPRPVAGRKQGTASQASQGNQASSFWDF